MTDVEVKSEVTGTIWKIEMKVGDAVDVGDEILIVESMKMEIPVMASIPGRISKITVSEGQPVEEGDTLAIIEAQK